MGPIDVPPSTARLRGLPPDEWALLLIQARDVLQELPDDPEHPDRKHLGGLPTGRLAGGKARTRLIGLLATDTRLWRAVAARLEAHPDGSVVFDALAAANGDDDADTAPATRPSGAPGPDTERSRAQALEDARRRAARDRERLGSARRERDEARRRLETAERRAETAEQELTQVRARVHQLESDIDELRTAIQAADEDRARAVQRERRRRKSELSDLEAEVASLRRKDEDRRARDRRAAREQRRSEQAPAPPPEVAPRPPRLVPGRPSRLPAEVVPGTREAVDLFLHRGRRLLVDGYNVTLQHQPKLDLEQQRAWLITALTNLAKARGVVPTVVFDGERSGGPWRGGSRRDIEVRFSAPGVTADDEIVLEVEATDAPILVVTDDRELRDRVRRSGADTIGSRELTWVL